MDHNDVRHKLSEYIDGSVSPEERAAIEEHLKTCGKCGEALRELRKAIEHIRQVEEIEPPAWMAQKIMAKVRVETEQRQNFAQRLYSALVVNLPVKAVAVAFLAVIAFFTYRDVMPPIAPQTVREESPAKSETISPGLAVNEQRIMKAPAFGESRIPREPGYKALDMKPEYERPPTPVLADKITAAPAPAQPAEQVLTAKRESAKEKRAFAPQTGAASTANNRAVAAAGAVAKSGAQLEATPRTPASGKSIPGFRDYRVAEIYGGLHHRVDLNSHPDAKTWRTRLIEAANKGSNFAGHYTIAVWGCGPSCSAFGIIDAITGKVYFPATLTRVGWSGWTGKEHGLKFRIESNLLIVQGSPNEGEKKGIFYYLWKNNNLELIDYSPVP